MILRNELLYLFLPSFALHVVADDILGCGGFVKSDVDINFSRVEVKLYTKQGSLKYQTDCAPTNGYYFLPLYDKGEYILKIDPPYGWSFEPNDVNLLVDGTADSCSQGKDINFQFKGFAVAGKVLSQGSSDGPAGVKVVLRTGKEDAVLQQTTTEKGGKFLFTPVLPGSYVVEASHPKWQMLHSRVAVNVANDNANVESGLVVAGFDVTGYVTSDAEPIRGVSFVLFSKEGGENIAYGCDRSPIPGFEAPVGPWKIVCHAVSDDGGMFQFPILTPGNYKVIPFYEGENIKFDVRPSELDFSVLQDSISLPTKFQVKGFSVNGRVTTKPGGRGIGGAKVYVNGKFQCETKFDGSYQLENMQTGSYFLNVVSDDVKFNKVSMKITPNTPQLPDVVAASFRVIGQVVQEQLPAGVYKGPRSVAIASRLKDKTVVETDSSGSFTTYLAPGIYQLQVVVSSEELKKGVKFSPTFQEVEVKDESVSNIEFTQLRGKVLGKVQCMSPCSGIPVVLTSMEDAYISPKTTTTKEDAFAFQDVLPGNYKLHVEKEEWCWDHKELQVAVNSAETSGLVFKHTGFVVTFVSSHETNVDFTSDRGKMGRVTVQKGASKTCISDPGTYMFTPVGCHRYSVPRVKWESGKPSIVQLVAIAHLITGSVLSKEKDPNIYINIEAKNGSSTRYGPLKPNLRDGIYEYLFDFWGTPGEMLTLEPQTTKLLFYPPRVQITVQNDCMMNVVAFEAKKGHFISGHVTPPLAGVAITITSESLDAAIVIETDGSGKYVVGPLHGDKRYSISAEKEGYVLTQLEKYGTFGAYKLAEIIVEVVDDDGKPLPGVLLSLSGGDSYRQNTQTGGDGKMSFKSLSPGEYFLRPMMKEYQFHPSSKIIEVKEGATVQVPVKGQRVAFSCFGTVTSLSGEPEPGIVVEVVGLSEGTDADYCVQLQEESVSEENGHFRIRGLQPKCEYEVQLKQGHDVNSHIERATPQSRRVKVKAEDVRDMKFIVFRYFNQMDLTVRVYTSADHLKSLKMKLFREDIPDSPLHVVRLEQSTLIFFPALLKDGRSYYLQLESSLPRSIYVYENIVIHFHANVSYKHLKVKFEPVLKPMEQDMVQGSYFALPLIVMLLILAFNHQKILPFVSQVSVMMHSVVTPVRNNGGGDTVIVEQIGKRKVKPRKT